MEPTTEARRALFHVVRGAPTDEELAALTVTLAALTSPAGESPAAATRSAWNAPRLRRPLHPGPSAWRASTWPR